jgi:hypothetical protein
MAMGLMVLGAATIFAAEAEEGFTPIFNGKDLTGWEGDAKLWLVEDGVLIGRSTGIQYNDFLATTKSYGDFILRFQVKLVENKGNSGVQFRSKRVPPPSHEVLAGPSDEVLKKALKPGDWNDYEIEAVGNKVKLSINGVVTVDYTEADEKIAREGIIAVQIHSGGPMEVQFRNLRIKEVKETK